MLGDSRWLHRRAMCLLKAIEAEEAVSAAEAKFQDLFDASDFRRAEHAIAELIAGPGMWSAPAQRAKWLRNRVSCLLQGSGGLDAAEEAARLSTLLEPQSPAAHEMLATVLHRMVEAGQVWRIHGEVRESTEKRFSRCRSNVFFLAADGLLSLLCQVQAWQRAWQVTQNMVHKATIFQALAKARNQAVEIGSQRDRNEQQGLSLLDQRKFEEVRCVLST
jgi:hypothetical protein